MKFNSSVLVWRRRRVADPYNPKRTRVGSWADAEVFKLDGAYIASSSSKAAIADAAAVAQKSLFISQPDADIRIGDGVSVGVRGAAPDFEIRALPMSDVNPFTGWQPVTEVPVAVLHG